MDRPSGATSNDKTSVLRECRLAHESLREMSRQTIARESLREMSRQTKKSEMRVKGPPLDGCLARASLCLGLLVLHATHAAVLLPTVPMAARHGSHRGSQVV